MSPNKFIAAISYSLLALAALITGGQLINLSEISASALLDAGMNWDILAPSVQRMLSCMVGIRGLGLIAISLAMFTILAGPFRTGKPWARSSLSLLSLAGLVLSLEVVSGLDMMPGGVSPLVIMIPAICAAFAGVAFSYLDGPFEELHPDDFTPNITPVYERR